MKNFKGKINLAQIAPYLFIFLFCIVTTLLIGQNRELKDEVVRLQTMRMDHQLLQPGETLERVTIRLLDGKTISYGYDAAYNYLLFIMTPTCPHCEKMLPVWDALVSDPAIEGCHIMGFSVADWDVTSKHYLPKSPHFRIGSVTDDRFTEKYRVHGFPETVLLQKGKVKKVWSGELTESQVKEIKSYFGADKARAD
jgi:thiol-disulfide isomerase/thioredoxin